MTYYERMETLKRDDLVSMRNEFNQKVRDLQDMVVINLENKCEYDERYSQDYEKMIDALNEARTQLDYVGMLIGRITREMQNQTM